MIFDKKFYKIILERTSKKFKYYNFLYQLVGDNITERLQEINQEFSDILEISSRDNSLKKKINVIKKFNSYYQTNLIPPLPDTGSFICCDNELLPFKNTSFDLILTLFDAHYTNDFPGMLAQIQRCLKQNGIFIGSFLGGTSLTELRQVFIASELNLKIPINPHIIPMIEVKDAGMLLQRVGFKDVIVDSFIYKVSYSSIYELMHDLRYMAQNNILSLRSKKPLTRKLLTELNKVYFEKYSNDDGHIIASFEVITLTGMMQ
jgi:SAM-dependent methyltransferase